MKMAAIKLKMPQLLFLGARENPHSTKNIKSGKNVMSIVTGYLFLFDLMHF